MAEAQYLWERLIHIRQPFMAQVCTHTKHNEEGDLDYIISKIT